MSAIVKSVIIHGDNLQPLLDYGNNINKTSMIDSDIEALLAYGSNSEKTTIQLPDEGEEFQLVTGVYCNPNTANQEFAMVRNAYREGNPEYFQAFDYFDKRTGKTREVEKEPVTAIHLIQSFDDVNIDPKLAHQIGIEFLERMGVQGVVDTHCNQDTSSKYGASHIHNHCIINAYMPDCQTKFCMNKEKLMNVRRLSNEILEEYGLDVGFLDPELQLELSRTNKAQSIAEIKQRDLGNSWKENIRNMIIQGRNISDTPEEFLEFVEASGFKIERKQGMDSVMYVDKDNHKVWDKTLGQDFMLCNLFPDAELEHQVKIEQEADIRKRYKLNQIISVAKYDYSGRKRTLLELSIRRAIAIIQRVAVFINRKIRQKNTNYNPDKKIMMMQDALQTLKDYDINSIEELNEAIDIAGKNTNLSKKAKDRIDTEMKYYSTAEKLITNYKNSKQLFDSVIKWNNPNIMLLTNEYDEYTISKNISSIAPLSTRQRSDLFNMLANRPDIRIKDAGKGFDNVNAIQFAQIKDYLKGKIEKPDFIISAEEDNINNSYKNSYDAMKKYMSFEPSKKAINTTIELLKSKGIDNIKPEDITMADVINIQNCYGANPFELNALSDKQLDYIKKELEKANLTPNKRVEYLTNKEFNQILKYIENPETKIPAVLVKESSIYQKQADLLREIIQNGLDERVQFNRIEPLLDGNEDEIKAYTQVVKVLETKGLPLDTALVDVIKVLDEAETISKADIELVKNLQDKLGVKSFIPVEEMNAGNIKDYKQYLISQGKEPMIVTQAKIMKHEENKKNFHDLIAEETPKKQDVLIGLRNSINALTQIGINPDNIDAMLDTISEKKAELKDLSNTAAVFSDEYKSLLRLKQQTLYAQDPAFLYGALFSEKEIKEIEEEQVKAEKEQEKDKEPDNLTKDKHLHVLLSRYGEKRSILDKNMDL